MSIRLHWEFIKTHYAERMAYRTDFFMSIIIMMLFQFSGPFFVAVIYKQGLSFPGWTFGQVWLLQGIVSLVEGIAYVLFFGIFWTLVYEVKKGILDTLLIKPVNTLWLLIMRSFDSEDIGQVLSGILLITTAIYLLGGVSGSIVFFLLLLLFGILFYFSLAVLFSALTIHFTQTQRLHEFLLMTKLFASYPKSIYSKTIIAGFTFLFPLFIIGNYPAATLLNLPQQGVFIAILATLFWLFCCLLFWNYSLRKYSGAGG